MNTTPETLNAQLLTIQQQIEDIERRADALDPNAPDYRRQVARLAAELAPLEAPLRRIHRTARFRALVAPLTDALGNMLRIDRLLIVLLVSLTAFVGYVFLNLH